MHASIGSELILAGIGVAAGALGALVGIGGGIIVVPCLVLLFGVSIRVAVAASLIAVVATSTAAGSVYVGSGTANMRLGMTLEIATTLGGITGMLISNGVWFVQVLEGDEAAVEACYARIEKDGRHHRPTVRARKPVPQRAFSRWSMCGLTLSLLEEGLLQSPDIAFDVGQASPG